MKSKLEERNKFLTIAMGKCWHENYSHEEPTFEDRYDKYICISCGKKTSYSPHFPKINFSTWEGLGILLKWSRNQSWWNQFAGNNGEKVFIFEDNIDPDIFANKLFSWARRWFPSVLEDAAWLEDYLFTFPIE
jgi:hypothetical protein